MIGRTAPKRTLLWNLVQFFEYTDELLPDAPLIAPHRPRKREHLAAARFSGTHQASG